MSDVSRHSEWLSLMDISGPFLEEPVLDRVFPQGLEDVDPSRRKLVRQAYDEWRESVDGEEVDAREIHAAWVSLVLGKVLELDGDGRGDVLKSGATLPASLVHESTEHGIALRPDYALLDGGSEGTPLLLVTVCDPSISLRETTARDGWAASPAERMVDLCRGLGVRSGLVTNGEHWMLVDAPAGATTTFATWHARLWVQEPITLRAFACLLGIRRFFVDPADRLPALINESLKFQDEVTDALGEQVRRAVEVLIQALDRADVDRNRDLLRGIEPSELYEAGLTVMMRIVFLLSAEERGLLLMGDGRYEANYAVSTLRMQLRAESEEILERRWDAWSRLLALFRAVYGGVEHEILRLPALGGSLFDPDRFPFLEGRAKGSDWRADAALPLPIDNRTVLLLLDAVQLLRGRTLSYLALDVEQIGYVYEGLLERTVVRAEEVTLDLDATKATKKSWVTLAELESAKSSADGVNALLAERTGSSAGRIRNDLAKPLEAADGDRLLTACQGDAPLRDRVAPYYHFLRVDRWGYPLVYPKGTFMVTIGTDRRESGTHYTPKSLTETIVRTTLEPLAYVGPAEGEPRDVWRLRSATELLDLRICDPAMGSGAFLVQACRWLSERVVEAWLGAEGSGASVAADGTVVDDLGNREPVSGSPEDRLVLARRLIAERCLYGVDINPLAVELAKLSIWLVTLAKGRPFGFLDHNLRSGDSLLGIRRLEQLHYLEMNPGPGSSRKLFAHDIDKSVDEALKLRLDLRTRPINDIRDVEVMAGLDELARAKLSLPSIVADALVGLCLESQGKAVDTTMLSIRVGNALHSIKPDVGPLTEIASRSLATDAPARRSVRRPFHWPLEFPEIFSRENPGFDTIVGNPPFMGGRKISSNLGAKYGACIKSISLPNKKGSINLVMFFLLRGADFTRMRGTIGFIATDSVKESDTREIGMTALFSMVEPYCAVATQPWPGTAGVHVSVLQMFKGTWMGPILLNGGEVAAITTMLEPGEELPKPKSLASNIGFCSDGVKVQGIGFVLHETEALPILRSNPSYDKCLTRYIVGDDINNHLRQLSDRWVINFWDRPRTECEEYGLLWDIIVERVKPYRDGLTKQVHENCFWKFWDRREAFFDRVRAKGKVLVISKLSKYIAITFGDPNFIYSEKVKVFDFSSFGAFGVLQSSFHLIWARTWGSSTGETPAYVGSSCFDTFPFPEFMSDASGHLVSDAELPSLKSVAEQLFVHRQGVLASRAIGLTDIYNLVHDPKVTDDDIVRLRDLHVLLDDAVAVAYGWSGLDMSPSFVKLGGHRAKEEYRFQVSDETRAKIVSGLIRLNQERPGAK
jgi:hypothetical protein